MGKALYRKYRSRSLDEIVGQSHITALLARAVANGNIAHAYLLTGPKGVGKTSIARILAHEINGLPYSDEATHLDIIEIDAASNNSVEDIRDLREKVMIAPSVAKKKVYIIDEVHMLSKSAFNALLKTLEEPPEHVVFILATTDVEKLPATIVSRVQRFNFRTISTTDAVRHLRSIADSEHIAINDAALELIARHGKGSFRDSISLLDQLQSLTDDEVTPILIENILGLADTETVQQLLTAYEEQDIARISQLIAEAETRGTPATLVAEQLIQTIRSQIIEKPQLLPLLDKLLDIGRSAWPHVKLLTALASNVTPVTPNKKAAESSVEQHEQVAPSQKSAQAGDSAQNVSSTDESILGADALAAHVPRAHKSASQAQLDGDIVLQTAVGQSSPADQRRYVASTPEASAGNDASEESQEGNQTTKEELDKKDTTPKGTLAKDQPFPWSDFLASVKELSPGAHSLLTKCGNQFDGTKLTIYAGKPFVKKKLDQALPHLSASLANVGVADGTITVLATIAPPKDSQAASILDIMGGGEEVSL